MVIEIVIGGEVHVHIQVEEDIHGGELISRKIFLLRKYSSRTEKIAVVKD